MSLLQGVRRAFFSSLSYGGMFALFYLLFFFGSAMLVTGDGRAPQVTHFAVWTVEFPLSCLGMKNTPEGLFAAAIFWSAGFAALVFAVRLLVLVIRGTDTAQR